MSQIPSNAITSVAQSQLSASRRAAETDKQRETAARQADRQQRRRADSREFVEDMAAATGLKVDGDQRRQGDGGKKHKPQPDLQPEPPTAVDGEDDSRAHVAALLANPEEPDNSAPPPFMLDIEA